MFDAAWIREIRPRPVLRPLAAALSPATGKIRNVRGYIRRIPSVEGQVGDRACFTVACFLAESCLTFEEIVAELERGMRDSTVASQGAGTGGVLCH